MSARVTRTKVERLIERARKQGNTRLSEALSAWGKLSRDEQLRLAAEIVASRGAELRLAYPSILSIAYGFRTSTPRVRRRVHPEEVCVSFLIKTKWAPRENARSRKGELPAYLWSYCTIGENRVLCAVPTDIEARKDYRAAPNAETDASSGPAVQYVLVQDDASTLKRGVLTCEVKIEGDETRYAMGCHHVLALSTSTRPPGSPSIRARVFQRPARGVVGDQIGGLSAFRGRLVTPERGYSLDVALAEITDAAAFDAVLNSEPLAGAIASALDLPTLAPRARLITPDGIRILRLVKVWHEFDSITYFATPPQPLHSTVVEWQVERGGSVKGGHSGSPVLHLEAPILLGMHIAGFEGQSSAYMLPADELLDLARYGGAGSLSIVR